MVRRQLLQRDRELYRELELWAALEVEWVAAAGAAEEKLREAEKTAAAGHGQQRRGRARAESTAACPMSDVTSHRGVLRPGQRCCELTWLGVSGANAG